jgi:hypothetical protein
MNEGLSIKTPSSAESTAKELAIISASEIPFMNLGIKKRYKKDPIETMR